MFFPSGIHTADSIFSPRLKCSSPQVFTQLTPFPHPPSHTHTQHFHTPAVLHIYSFFLPSCSRMLLPVDGTTPLCSCQQAHSCRTAGNHGMFRSHLQLSRRGRKWRLMLMSSLCHAGGCHVPSKHTTRKLYPKAILFPCQKAPLGVSQQPPPFTLVQSTLSIVLI